MEPHTYPLYSKQEVLDMGIVPVYWKQAKPGDMAVSDDDWCGECLFITHTKTNNPKDPTKGYHLVRCVFGYQLNSPGTKLWAKKKNDVKSHNYRNTKAKDTVHAYCMMRVKGENIDWDALGRMYAPYAGIPRAYAKKFIRSDRTQIMVREELAKILSGVGFTPTHILEEYGTLLNSCKDDGGKVVDKGVFKETLDTLADMADMHPDKIEMSANWNVEVPQGISMAELNEMDQKLLNAKAKELTDGTSKQTGDAEEVQGEHPDVR